LPDEVCGSAPLLAIITFCVALGTTPQLQFAALLQSVFTPIQVLVWLTEIIAESEKV
jgi:hypothetical protein